MRAAIIAFAALAVLAVVATVGGRLSRSAGADEERESRSFATSSTSAGELDSIRTVADPVDLAVRVVALTGDVVLAGPIGRRELIESFATPEFGPTLADTTADQLSGMQLEFGVSGIASTDLRVVEVPVTARLVKSESDRARVEVWSALVIAVERSGGARQAWRTVEIDLLLVDGRWLVDGWTSSLGPTPALAPEAPLSSADDVAAVLDWTTVGAGGG